MLRSIWTSGNLNIALLIMWPLLLAYLGFSMSPYWFLGAIAFSLATYFILKKTPMLATKIEDPWCNPEERSPNAGVAIVIMSTILVAESILVASIWACIWSYKLLF